MADFRLETQRLVLRDWREDDWPAFFRHTNTPGVMQWLGGQLDDDAMAGARGRVERYASEHGHTFWLVERQDDDGHLSGELLGFCGLKRCNQPGGPVGDMEIGWRLREDAWGKGYAIEAARAAMRAGFEQFDAPHMVALTVAENVPSWKLMERLGMRRRADLDFPGSDWAGADPIIVYSIDRDAWLATQ